MHVCHLQILPAEARLTMSPTEDISAGLPRRNRPNGPLPAAWKLYHPERVARTRQLSRVVCTLSLASLIAKCVLVGHYLSAPACNFSTRSPSTPAPAIAIQVPRPAVAPAPSGPADTNYAAWEPTPLAAVFGSDYDSQMLSLFSLLAFNNSVGVGVGQPDAGLGFIPSLLAATPTDGSVVWFDRRWVLAASQFPPDAGLLETTLELRYAGKVQVRFS
jgi:hypothetical protein